MTEKQKTFLSYVIAVGIALAVVAVGAAMARWPDRALIILDVCVGLYLFRGLAKLVRDVL